MSLWDVDKNSDKRSSPQLNQRDQIAQRISNATTSVNPVTDATATSGFLKTANGQILGNNGTNNVGLFGFDDTGTMVVKVAKPGYDANSATNDQLVFNSSQNVFKIVDKLTTTIPSFSLAAGAGNRFKIITIPHLQSSTPLVEIYVQSYLVNFSVGGFISSTYTPLPVVYDGSPNTYVFPAADMSSYPLTIRYAVDSTNIYIQASYASTAATTVNDIPVTYFIKQESAS